MNELFEILDKENTIIEIAFFLEDISFKVSKTNIFFFKNLHLCFRLLFNYRFRVMTLFFLNNNKNQQEILLYKTIILRLLCHLAKVFVRTMRGLVIFFYHKLPPATITSDLNLQITPQKHNFIIIQIK